MDRGALLEFLRGHSLAVQASVGETGEPQAALVGFVVTDRFEFFFDTLDSARKVRNLRQRPRAALVVGGWAAGDERTAQIEGSADEPRGADLDRLLSLYFARFPEGRTRTGVTYIRVRADWIRFADYTRPPALLFEFRERDF